MHRLFALILAGLCLGLPAAPEARAEGKGPITVGLILTLSGPGGALGRQARDGFQLYLQQHAQMFGGRDVNLVVVDDELQPERAAGQARTLIERDKASIVVGPSFSQVMSALVAPVTRDAILVSPGPGPRAFAGKACSPYVFVTSAENGQVHQVGGEVADQKGYKRAMLLASDDEAGREAASGFKRTFKGEVLAEDYLPLETSDATAALARVAAAKPDLLYAFLPGEAGVVFVRQFRAAFGDRLPLLSALTADESTLPAQGEAAIGLTGGMIWAPNADNPANRAFEPAFEAALHAVPASEAMQAYDAAQVIDRAITQLGGETRDRDALASAIRAADIQSPRGSFRFNKNGYPVQDFFVGQVVKRADGKLQTEERERVFLDKADDFANDCGAK